MRLKFLKENLIDEKSIIKILKDYIDISRKPKLGSVFLTKDGTFINLGENEDDSHGDIISYLENEDIFLFDDHWQFSENFGYIRMNSGTTTDFNAYIEFLEDKPTSEQYDGIENWLYYILNSGVKEVEINVPDSKSIRYSLVDYLPEDIIKKVKRYYGSGTLYEGASSVVYKDISELDHYKKSANEILGGYGDLSDNSILDNNKEIYIDGELKGYIGLSEYQEDDGTKLLGIGNFMILERGKGYGTQVLQHLINKYKNEYDLIYCFVDSDNEGAIKLYKKLGKVYDEDGPNDNGQYYVTFYDNGKYKLEEDYDPPYNAQQIKDNYGIELYNKLIKDPAHRWRMETGIELIHKEPTKEELERIWKNWQEMSKEQKEKSDKKSLELFGKTNEENYYDLIKLYESIDNNKNIDDIETPEQLMAWMDENITYELANDEYGAEDDPPTKTAEEVIETGTGHCAEQSYLEYKVLDDLGYFPQIVFVKENNSKKDYGADGSAHMFVVYQDDDEKYVYFEHSQEHNKGIHKFDSMSELLDFVGKNWWRYDANSDILEVRYIDEPITGVNNWELAQECHKYEVDEVLDISNNVMEDEVPQDAKWDYNKHKIVQENLVEDVYMSSEQDSEGNILTLEQVKYFSNSKVKDKSGKLLVCYHSTDEEFDEFDSSYSWDNFGFHFGTKEAAEDIGGEIMKSCYLNITNPLILKEDLQYWDALSFIRLLYENPQLQKDIKIDGWEEIKQQYEEDLEYGDFDESFYFAEYGDVVRDALYNSKYDGVIYPNWGEDAGSISYMCFYPEQIKYIGNKTPTRSKRMNESQNLSKQQEDFFKNSKIRKLNGELIICTHCSDEEFETFDVDRVGSGSGGVNGYGFYFTSHETNDNGYGKNAYKCYLNITNPFIFTDDPNEIIELCEQCGYQLDQKDIDFALSEFDKYEYDYQTSIDDLLNGNVRLFTKMIKDCGYDGIWSKPYDEVIAFYPNQIKRITNENPTNSNNMNEGAYDDEEEDVSEQITNEFLDVWDDFYHCSTEDILDLLEYTPSDKIDASSPMFILPNGKIVNVADVVEQWDYEYPLVHHALPQVMAYVILKDICSRYGVETEQFMYEEDGLLDNVTDEMIHNLTYSKDWARINCGTLAVESRFYCVLPNHMKSAQYYTLEEWLLWGEQNNKKEVLVFCGNEQQNQKYKFNELFTEGIMKKIKRFYSSGVLFESGATGKILYRGEGDSNYSVGRIPMAGLFYATNYDDASNFSDNVVKYRLNSNSKIYKGQSSLNYCIENDLMDIQDKDLKNMLGVSTLIDMYEESSVPDGYFPKDEYLDDRPFFGTQLIAKKDLQKKGYDGAYWKWEDDLTPQQYQIWNMSVVEKVGQIKEDFSDIDKSEYLKFQSYVESIIDRKIKMVNRELDKFGFEVEYIDDYDFTENDQWIGVFYNEIQNAADVFPIAINIPFLYRECKKDKYLKDDLPYHIEKTIWHEAGHGIFEYLYDVFDLEDLDEEKVVEEYASYQVGDMNSPGDLLDCLYQYLENN